mmetsp:Transcript_2661/g.7049  ORF Transcript_2661/g.7049 Transcript_2661/m.7049 type:complete len:248 (+) Transcript_2661:3-746(+)
MSHTWSAVADAVLVVLVRLAKTPALQAAFSAILLASVPSIKRLLVASSSPSSSTKPADPSQPPLYFVYDAVSTLGQAQVPVSMIMLSGTATLRFMKTLRKKAIRTAKDTHSDHSDHSEEEDSPLVAGGGRRKKKAGGGGDEFSARAVAAILVGRTVLMPLAGLGWWWVLQVWLGAIPDIRGHSKILQLVILIESAVPTAQNVVMLLLVHGRMEQGEQLAQIVLAQMAVSVLTFTLACSFFQWLVIPM